MTDQGGGHETQESLPVPAREDPASTTDRSRVVDSRLRRRAIRNGLIVGILLAPCFMAAWVVFVVFMVFLNSAISGAADRYFEWWERFRWLRSAMIYLSPVFLVAAAIRIGRGAYRRTIERKPRRYWLIALAVSGFLPVVTGLIVVTWAVWPLLWLSSDSPRPLIKQLAGLELGDDFKLVAEEHSGATDCLFGECRNVERYYVSQLTVEQACRKATAALRSWADEVSEYDESYVDRRPEEEVPPCDLFGTKGRYGWVSGVGRDMTIYEQDAVADERPITEPHRSVLFVRLDEGEPDLLDDLL